MADGARKLSRRVAADAGALMDIGPRRAQRRVWARNGRAHIEVRGLCDAGVSRRRRLAAGASSALRTIHGVNWVEVNAVTGHVLAAGPPGSRRD